MHPLSFNFVFFSFWYSQRNKAVQYDWGNHPNFQVSFGLKMTDEDIQKSKEILKAMVKADNQMKQKSSGWSF